MLAGRKEVEDYILRFPTTLRDLGLYPKQDQIRDLLVFEGSRAPPAVDESSADRALDPPAQVDSPPIAEADNLPDGNLLGHLDHHTMIVARAEHGVQNSRIEKTGDLV